MNQPPERAGADQWTRLDQLLTRAEGSGLRSLTGEELLELGDLYRRAAAQLSFAKTRALGLGDRDRLNTLVARAYGQLYRSAHRPLGSLRSFLLEDFPATFRMNWRFFAVAMLTLLLGAAIGDVVGRSEEATDTLLGPGWNQEVRHVAQRHTETGPRNWLPDGVRPMASALIITNNVRVSAMALAFGITGGAGTIVVLWENGLILGLIGHAVHAAGADADFWAFVAPHGVLELTAVFLAGASGLMLGYALLFPGGLYRRDSLKLGGRQAAKLLMGAALLLLPAGLIEAFFSPVPEVPHALKFLFALLAGAALYFYLVTVGRPPLPDSAPGAPLPVEPIACWLEAERRARA